MTKYEATVYARIALVNMIENKYEITTENLLYEMYVLFDLYDKESVKKKFY